MNCTACQWTAALGASLLTSGKNTIVVKLYIKLIPTEINFSTSRPSLHSNATSKKLCFEWQVLKILPVVHFVPLRQNTSQSRSTANSDAKHQIAKRLVAVSANSSRISQRAARSMQKILGCQFVVKSRKLCPLL